MNTERKIAQVVLDDQIDKTTLIDGSAFTDYNPMIQLGIQTLPGVKFYLNNSPHAIMIGQTGIYELNVYDLPKITSLRFDKASIDLLIGSPNKSLIVDILYEGSVNT